jgi:hypothetical protein
MRRQEEWIINIDFDAEISGDFSPQTLLVDFGL